MATRADLHRFYLQLRDDATRLAGGINDLAQRASVYHHLYHHSRGNHVFPLIAAHGALWASRYFRFGLRMALPFSWQYFYSSALRKKRLSQLNDFADAFREVNRRICIDTYVKYHFSDRFGHHPDAGQFVTPNLLAAMNRCHRARNENKVLSDDQKRNVFLEFFLNEQESVVEPRISAAANAFEWWTLKQIAIRPLIRFSYFGKTQFFWFRNFVNREERVAKGLRAFEIALTRGLENVEAALDDYQVLPNEFFVDSEKHFHSLCHEVLAS